MRTYTVRKVQHPVYEDRSELPEGLVVKTDWHLGQKGDWVEADDGAVMQVLRQGELKHSRSNTRYIGTCTGTYLCKKGVVVDSARRKNIYSFGSDKNHFDIINERKTANYKEIMFAKFVASGMTPVDAYLKAFKTHNRKYAQIRSAILVKQERITMKISEELDNVFKELKIDAKYLIGKAKEELEGSDRASDRLKALQMLWDAAEVVPKQSKVTTVAGVFKGFDQKSLESVTRPSLKEV